MTERKKSAVKLKNTGLLLLVGSFKKIIRHTRHISTWIASMERDAKDESSFGNRRNAMIPKQTRPIQIKSSFLLILR